MVEKGVYEVIKLERQSEEKFRWEILQEYQHHSQLIDILIYFFAFLSTSLFIIFYSIHHYKRRFDRIALLSTVQITPHLFQLLMEDLCASLISRKFACISHNGHLLFCLTPPLSMIVWLHDDESRHFVTLEM